jgi:SAM-dependent methyltransferase
VTRGKRARALIARLAELFGLLPLLVRLYGDLLYARARLRAVGVDRAPADGLPVPPPRLLFLVTNECAPAWYFESGAAASSSLLELLGRNGVDLAVAAPILDFGCGCGRVIRRWHDLGVELHGTDVNPRLVEWCRGSLPFARFAVNGLEPPLAYADETFGLVYAFSVFTHMPAELEAAWIAELRRVLRPGGHLVVSTHGAAYLDRLGEAERVAFLAGRTVVRRGAVAGSNWCTTFHPEQAVRERLARGFDVVDFVPEGAKGNPVQDVTVLRKPR